MAQVEDQWTAREDLVKGLARVLGSYNLRVDVVPDVSDEGEQCTVCRQVGRLIAAEVHYSYSDEPFGEPDEDVQQCCMCCMCCIFPFIDSVPWLNIAKTITVEVSRGATHRPF